MSKNHDLASTTYTFPIHLGSLALKQQGSLTKDLGEIDTLISYLKPIPEKNQAEVNSIFPSVKEIGNDLTVKLARLWNLLFGNGEWYNEARAVKLMKNFIALSEEKKTEEMRVKFLDLYDRLENCGVDLKGIERKELEQKEISYEIYQFFCELVIANLPEMKEGKKLATSLLLNGGKKGAELAICGMKSYIGGNIGKKGTSPLGNAARSLMMLFLSAIAKDLNIDRAKEKKMAAITSSQ